MGEYNDHTSHDLMSVSIYHFLESLLAAVHTSETLATEANERDEINVPNDIKPGGYPEGIFLFLSEREKDEYICNVCYSVIKDAHQCSNGHKFCYSCIYVWSACNRLGADGCPVCRCDGIYARNEQVNDKIGCKRVKCQDDGCNWRGFLREYLAHEHRQYEFKEISRSIELPHLKRSDTASLSTSPLPDIHKRPIDRSQTYMESFPSSNTLEDSDPRVNIPPRRLPRLLTSISADNSLRNTPSITVENTSDSNFNGASPFPQEQRSSLLPPLDYRRLVPTYASRRHPFGLAHDGHEHLATILILLTTDLGERNNNVSNLSSRRNVPNVGMESNIISFHDRAANHSRAVVYHGGSRLDDLGTLRSMSDVSNSLDILMGQNPTRIVQEEEERVSGTVSSNSEGSSSWDHSTDSD